MRVTKSHKTFGGVTQFWEHESATTGTKMKFSTFVPESEVRGCLIWLSGLTCTEENFITKAGAQKYLCDASMMVLCPDTSPRGLNLPREHEADDFGSGAGFYVDATTDGYRDHYRMFSYVNTELYSWVQEQFGLEDRISISGHSMGGHGALVLGLRNPSKYRSVSAFSPIVHPSACPWGEKALTGYLGEDREAWRKYDACELLRAGHRHPKPILIDQGTEDKFLSTQLKTEAWARAGKLADQRTEVRYQAGFDHSYYFIASFIRDHVQFHAEHLRSTFL